MLDRLNRYGRRALLALAAAGLAALVAGCSGEGAGAGGSAAGNTSGTGAASDILVFTDTPALPSSDGSTSAIITAQVKDGTNNALRNQPVSFATTDTGVALSPVGTSNVTDSAGRVQVRLDLGSTAAARANRTVTVTATSGAASSSTTLAVVGTRLTITGPDSLGVGASAEYVVAAADATNAGVAGLPVTVAFTGGTPASSTVTTGSNGQARVTLTAGATAGASTVSASASGIDPVSRPVQVLGSDTPFRFVSPADNAEVVVNTDQTVVVQYQSGGAPVAGQAIVVTATRGTVNGQPSSNLVTDASGQASFVVRSASAGQSTVNATVFAGGSTNSVSTRLSFVSRTPSKITLNPDPTSIGANAAGSNSSTSRLVATVRDATDNPVKGALVTFSAVDPSNGRIEPGQAVTDASGQAVASFIAGPNSSGQDAVQVTSTVFNSSGAAVASDTKNMTVSAVALFIELGTGNSIEAVDSTTYSMPWSAIVTDANRNPIAGARVTASLVAVSYRKGIWAYNAAWSPVSFDNPTLPPITCPSEDLNRNNLLDAGEDVDGDARLDPGSPASVRVTSTDGNTGADGRATLAIIYPKSFGLWVEVTLRVTIATSGTESTVPRTFLLPVLADDVTTQTTAPPNVNARTPNNVSPANALVGPYGYVQDCANAN
jgi:hypothetical protein